MFIKEKQVKSLRKGTIWMIFFALMSFVGTFFVTEEVKITVYLLGVVIFACCFVMATSPEDKEMTTKKKKCYHQFELIEKWQDDSSYYYEFFCTFCLEVIIKVYRQKQKPIVYNKGEEP